MGDTKATQRAKILNYCAVHGSITVREAAVGLNINSPTKRISELRESHDVQTEWESRINSDGEKVRYLRYYISERGDTQNVPIPT